MRKSFQMLKDMACAGLMVCYRKDMKDTRAGVRPGHKEGWSDFEVTCTFCSGFGTYPESTQTFLFRS